MRVDKLHPHSFIQSYLFSPVIIQERQLKYLSHFGTFLFGFGFSGNTFSSINAFAASLKSQKNFEVSFWINGI